MLLTDEDLVILTSKVARYEAAISQCKLIIISLKQGNPCRRDEMAISEQEREIEHLEERLAVVKAELSRMLFRHIPAN